MHTIGAEELNREIGARPMRSRHCNEEQGQTMPLVKILGRLDQAMILSQENCLIVDCQKPYERWGGNVDVSLTLYASSENRGGFYFCLFIVNTGKFVLMLS